MQQKKDSFVDLCEKMKKKEREWGYYFCAWEFDYCTDREIKSVWSMLDMRSLIEKVRSHFIRSYPCNIYRFELQRKN